MMTEQYFPSIDFDVNEQRMTELAKAELLSLKEAQAFSLVNDEHIKQEIANPVALLKSL